jgi:integrase/recombinase XerD
MTQHPLSLPVHLWPDLDQRRWQLSQIPAEFLARKNPASEWSPARREIVADAYGQWLQFLTARSELEPLCEPGLRVTEQRLGNFIVQLQERVSPVSVAMMVGAIKRMLDALDPGWDSVVLATAYRNLKRWAEPSRDKASRMVSAKQLYDLGLHLMETCGEGLHETYVATRFRDGLVIAMLICCPVRVKNLSMMIVGQHLRFKGQRYQLCFAADETKTGRQYEADLPGALTPYVRRYLELHRPHLLSVTPDDQSCDNTDNDALWIGCRALHLTDKGLRTQIKLHTGKAFGAAIWPHLFRDCAVTELVDVAPDEIELAPDLLGHGSLQVTQKHYIQAKGMQSHRIVQATLAAARAGARQRQRRTGR